MSFCQAVSRVKTFCVLNLRQRLSSALQFCTYAAAMLGCRLVLFVWYLLAFEQAVVMLESSSRMSSFTDGNVGHNIDPVPLTETTETIVNIGSELLTTICNAAHSKSASSLCSSYTSGQAQSKQQNRLHRTYLTLTGIPDSFACGKSRRVNPEAERPVHLFCPSEYVWRRAAAAASGRCEDVNSTGQCWV